jgi:hypothetical protein
MVKEGCRWVNWLGEGVAVGLRCGMNECGHRRYIADERGAFFICRQS